MTKEQAIQTAKKLRKLACGNLKKDADSLIEWIWARKGIRASLSGSLYP